MTTISATLLQALYRFDQPELVVLNEGLDGYGDIMHIKVDSYTIFSKAELAEKQKQGSYYKAAYAAFPEDMHTYMTTSQSNPLGGPGDGYTLLFGDIQILSPHPTKPRLESMKHIYLRDSLEVMVSSSSL